jgi:hypothetical protein
MARPRIAADAGAAAHWGNMCASTGARGRVFRRARTGLTFEEA